MHELIHHDWLDHDYLAQHTLGWDLMRERALQWPPARAAAVCGITTEQITDLANAYGACLGEAGPAAIRLNYGMQRVRGGGNAVRLIATLPALIGAWRHRAGGMLLSSSSSFPVNRAALQRPDLLAGRRPRTINMSTIGDDLLRPASAEFGPAIAALVVYLASDESSYTTGVAHPIDGETMKLLRHGPSGAEKPGLLHSDGTIRDLSAVVADIGGTVLSDAGLAAIRAADPAKLPVVDGAT
eukprot:gene28951-50856_t